MVLLPLLPPPPPLSPPRTLRGVASEPEAAEPPSLGVVPAERRDSGLRGVPSVRSGGAPLRSGGVSQ
eukprot:814722-Prorocentrum_minimum.AAC.2